MRDLAASAGVLLNADETDISAATRAFEALDGLYFLLFILSPCNVTGSETIGRALVVFISLRGTVAAVTPSLLPPSTGRRQLITTGKRGGGRTNGPRLERVVRPSVFTAGVQ